MDEILTYIDKRLDKLQYDVHRSIYNAKMAGGSAGKAAEAVVAKAVAEIKDRIAAEKDAK